MNYRLLLLLIVVICWTASPAHAAAAAAAPAAEPSRQEWMIDGVAREALIAAPASAKSEPAPLVFVFHGHGGTMRNATRQFHLHDLWPEAIVVYPQGLNTPGRLTDPEGKKPGWQSGAGTQGDRDLKFFDAMLKTLRETYKVDNKRIYSTGHSNGGGFTYLLWSTRGDTFAAFAPSGAAAARAGELKPKPMLHIAGSKDPLVKFEWQEQMIASVRKLNGCAAEGKKAGEYYTTYTSPSGTPVDTYIYDGGHTFPAAAPKLIVAFFKEHAKK
jgi:polyhydroxybutyrate depolymerase